MATMKAHPDDPRLQSWSAYAAQRISSGDDAAGLKRQKKAKEAREQMLMTFDGWMTWMTWVLWCFIFKACCELCLTSVLLVCCFDFLLFCVDVQTL